MKLCFLAALSLALLSAQTFDVASVKPAGPIVPGAQLAPRGGPGTDDPGRISWPHVTMLDLILQAYDVTVDQVSGLAWLKSAGTIYDLDATIPPGATKEQFRLMLQNLLADRFHLKLHHETQSRAGYELSVAPGGPKLKDWIPAPGAAPGLTMGVNPDRGTLRTTFRGSMADICRQLGAPVNLAVDALSPRPHIAEKTGLSGMYEFVLEYATTFPPPGAPGAQPATPPPADAAVPAASDPIDARGFFAAFEKLGLRLVKVKDVPIDIIVVDSADKVPAEN